MPALPHDAEDPDAVPLLLLPPSVVAVGEDDDDDDGYSLEFRHCSMDWEHRPSDDVVVAVHGCYCRCWYYCYLQCPSAASVVLPLATETTVRVR